MKEGMVKLTKAENSTNFNIAHIPFLIPGTSTCIPPVAERTVNCKAVVNIYSIGQKLTAEL
jgi:hypothetical protein